jgi:chloramphenicol 3-O-phosphotransferase
MQQDGHSPSVVVLNGIPCAGKSSLARSFQDLRAADGELWLHVALDVFDAMLPAGGVLTTEQYAHAAQAMVASVVSMARLEVNLVIELVLRPSDPGAAAVQRELLGALLEFKPVLVAVLVSPAVALAREEARSGPADGLVRRDLSMVETNFCDLAVSTDDRSPRQAAMLLDSSLGRASTTACEEYMLRLGDVRRSG